MASEPEGVGDGLLGGRDGHVLVAEGARAGEASPAVALVAILSVVAVSIAVVLVRTLGTIGTIHAASFRLSER